MHLAEIVKFRNTNEEFTDYQVILRFRINLRLGRE